VNVRDFDGACHPQNKDELLARLSSVRRGSDGAFVLDHGEDQSLYVHIHETIAFLWYCPNKDGTHPGFVPDRMWTGNHGAVEFRMVSEYLADSITVQSWQLVPLEVAYKAAVEFMLSPVLPESVSWFEL
jgi:hypothetical protein